MKTGYTELPLTCDFPISNGASVPNVVLPTAMRVPRTASDRAAWFSTAGTAVVSTA